MKNTIKTITLGTFLATGTLFGGGDIAPVVVPVVPVPVDVVDPNPLYIGVGALWAGVSRDCYCPPDEIVRVKDTTYGGIVRLGYDYNQYIGIEGRALKATIQSDFAETTHYGIFLKPMVPVADQVNLYGLLGYGRTEVKVDCIAMHDTFKYNGFSFGVGLEYDLTGDEPEEGTYAREFDGAGDQEESWGLWIDYQNLMNNEGPDNYKVNIITFGVTYDF